MKPNPIPNSSKLLAVDWDFPFYEKIYICYLLGIKVPLIFILKTKEIQLI